LEPNLNLNQSEELPDLIRANPENAEKVARAREAGKSLVSWPGKPPQGAEAEPAKTISAVFAGEYSAQNQKICPRPLNLLEALGGDWPEPESITNELPPVPSFDLRLLPESLRALVEDTADRMQVPTDFPAVTAVMCLAGAVNRRALVQPKRADHSWAVVPNLWGGIVAPPGQMKSPIISAITAPLRAVESEWRTEQEKALEAYERQAEEAELHVAAWRESFKQAAKGKGVARERPTSNLERPTARRLLTSDGTFEALHALLADNPAGVFVLRDELTGWLASLDRQGREEQRAFYLESWNGDQSFTLERIGRGSVHVEHCCISLFGGIQPARLRSYLAEALADGPSNDGLIQRFQLLVWPDQRSSWNYIDRKPCATARGQAESVYRRLTGMSAENPKRLKFDDRAQELFVRWLAELETVLVSDSLSPVMQAHLAKYRSLMPALALLFALADGCEDDIPLRHAQRAASWCDYLKPHAARVYSARLTSERAAAAGLARRLRDGWSRDEGSFNLRKLYNNGWSGLGTPDEARQALTILEDASWVRKQSRPPDPGKGRPSELWSINPLVYIGGVP
jgi:putative DNA primase/helicase